MAEKEPEKKKIRLGRETNGWPLRWSRTQRSISIILLTKADQANWRAGHCEFVNTLWWKWHLTSGLFLIERRITLGVAWLPGTAPFNYLPATSSINLKDRRIRISPAIVAVLECLYFLTPYYCWNARENMKCKCWYHYCLKTFDLALGNLF